MPTRRLREAVMNPAGREGCSEMRDIESRIKPVWIFTREVGENEACIPARAQLGILEVLYLECSFYFDKITFTSGNSITTSQKWIR